MSYLPNREALEKADLALQEMTAGGGVLLPAQAKKFLRLLTKKSVLMGMSTVVPMAAPKQQIPRIKLSSRILRPGTENVPLDLAARSRPDFSMVELDAKLFRAEIRLSDEVLEDSIERGDLRQTIIEMMAEAIARDMEDVGVNGNRTSPDPFLAVMDGLLVQATSHIVDAAGQPLSPQVLHELIRSLPGEYLRDKKALAYLTSVDAELGYRRQLAERATAAGDRYLETDTPVLYSGVPVQPIPLFPENLGAQQNQSNVLLVQPQNVVFGIWRQVRIESWRDISAGQLRIVATIRFDTRYADEAGVARAINVRV